jgi:hypothetical protein
MLSRTYCCYVQGTKVLFLIFYPENGGNTFLCKPYGVTYQKAAILMLTAVRTPKLIKLFKSMRVKDQWTNMKRKY